MKIIKYLWHEKLGTVGWRRDVGSDLKENAKSTKGRFTMIPRGPLPKRNRHSLGLTPPISALTSRVILVEIH